MYGLLIKERLGLPFFLSISNFAFLILYMDNLTYKLSTTSLVIFMVLQRKKDMRFLIPFIIKQKKYRGQRLNKEI